MKFVAPDLPPPLARWTSRVAFFSLALLATAIFLHRLFPLPTAVALNIVAAAFAGAALALLLALLASIQIWRTGLPGTARVVAGLAVAGCMLGGPLLLLPQLRSLPAINDLSTNTASPPQFVALAKARPRNTVAYPGARFASLQQEAYPDLKTLVVDRPVEEAYELVSDALRRQKIKVAREEPPSPNNPKGTIEATDRTLVFGFYDDLAIRVEGDGKQSRIDLRSASRYGRHDLGRNAERIRTVLKEIVARLEATVPTASGERIGSLIKKKRLLKRAKEGDPKSKDPKSAGGPAQADGSRAPQQKAQQPPKDAGRGRGRRQGQSFE